MPRFTGSITFLHFTFHLPSLIFVFSTASINVALYMASDSFLYITALEGPGNFSILCGEYGTTIVENAPGNNQQTVLLCGYDYIEYTYTGELILYGNFIIYANGYIAGNIKLDGSLTYVSRSLTIRYTSKIPNNSSIIIPSGGLLSFENSYYMWPNLPWSLTWQPYGAVALFMSSLDFGSTLTLDEGRQIIFLPMNNDDSLMSIIEADYILVSNTSKLWFQNGAVAEVIGSIACEGTLDLTSPKYYDNGFDPYATNITINGNLTLYNSSTVLIPQQMMLLGDPWGVGFISVQDSLYLAGTLNVSIGGDDFQYNKLIDIPIIQAGKIYGDFQTFIPTILLTDYNYTLTYSIEENVVVLHLQQLSP